MFTLSKQAVNSSLKKKIVLQAFLFSVILATSTVFKCVRLQNFIFLGSNLGQQMSSIQLFALCMSINVVVHFSLNVNRVPVLQICFKIQTS